MTCDRFTSNLMKLHARKGKSMILISSLVLTIFALFTTSPGGDEGQNNWASFRGYHASGIGEGQHLPDSWNGEKGTNIKWKTRIPGLAHSSPIVWGNRVFVTTAISSLGDGNFKPGLYGEGTASEDRSVHKWKIFALDKYTGKVVW